MYLSQSRTSGSDVVRFENVGGWFEKEQSDSGAANPIHGIEIIFFVKKKKKKLIYFSITCRKHAGNKKNNVFIYTLIISVSC